MYERTHVQDYLLQLIMGKDWTQSKSPYLIEEWLCQWNTKVLGGIFHASTYSV